MNNEMMKELLINLLECGYLDLDILKSCTYDMYDLIEEVKEFSEKIDINNLCYAMFILALRDCQISVEEKIDELESNDDLSEDELEELKALKEVDFREDIETFHNYIDTHVYLSSYARNKEEIYQNYCKEEFDLFSEKTGFDIEI